jgi:hypothetical protein
MHFRFKLATLASEVFYVSKMDKMRDESFSVIPKNHAKISQSLTKLEENLKIQEKNLEN